MRRMLLYAHGKCEENKSTAGYSVSARMVSAKKNEVGCGHSRSAWKNKGTADKVSGFRNFRCGSFLVAVRHHRCYIVFSL